MRRWWLRGIIAVAALVVVARMLGWWGTEPISVKAVRAELGRVESTITNSKAGTIRARRRADLSAEVGGRVVAIEVREGAVVQAGDVLVLLDSTSHTAQLKLAEESLRVAEARQREVCIARDRADRELQRKRKLADKNIISKDSLDQLESVLEGAHATCSAATASVDRERAQIVAAQAELDKLTIRAPFDGVIAEVGVELGEWVTPSPPMLTAPAVVDLIDISSLYVSAPMDEVDSSAVRRDQEVKVTIDSFPEREFAGRVVRVAPYVLDIEAQNRTVEIEVELDDREFAATLLPGTSADVEVIRSSRDNVLRIPTPSVLDGGRVLVADNGVLREQAVETGLKNWDFVEIVSGLEAGQRVVVSLDSEDVKDGAKVVVEETTFER